VTAFHVVEHWPFAALVAFLDEAYRVLVPGGVLILETPDPSNLLVSGWAFHLDPTHLRPLPRPLLKLVVEARGFADTEVLGLRPIGVPATMEPLELREWLESHFGGAQDYALVARRAQGG
jgi:O-antigen chain-terminating methyltransferase